MQLGHLSPRIVACPCFGCSGPNYEQFRYCQWCGVARKMLKSDAITPLTIADHDISNRKKQLMLLSSEKTHAVAKLKEFDEFSMFLRSRSDASKRREDVFSAIPNDVVDYIIFRDLSGDGRTVVHKWECMTRPMNGECGCPKRMSADTVRTLASKLKSKFYELGACGAWNSTAGSGNPADSGLVRTIVKSVKEEQGMAGVAVMSARRRALLPLKLKALLNKMRDLADTEFDNAIKRKISLKLPQPNFGRYVRVLQDMAWIAIQYRALNRGSELSSLRVGQTAIGPNEECLVFHLSFTKVIRGGKSKEFGVKRLEGDPSCPVNIFRQYTEATRDLFGWDWELDGAWVFDSFCMTTCKRKGEPVSQQAMALRFKQYLVKLDMDDSDTTGVFETLHGLRAGGALAMAMEGESLTDIMLQGFWKSPKTALHYIGLLKAVVGKEFMEALERSKDGSLLEVASDKEIGTLGQSYIFRKVS